MPRTLSMFLALRSVLLSVVAVLLVAALPARADDTAYNKGVQAFRAKDFAEARRLWAQSIAEGGPDEAFNNLGFLLFSGKGGEADHDRAVALWRKGAALSVSESQFHLGHAYEDGTGVEQDRVRALAWYLCALATAQRARANDSLEQSIAKHAQESETSLRRELSSDELKNARRLAEQLIARYSQRLDPAKP